MLFVNLVVILMITTKYIENWLQKKDDLTGETDAIRELTGHDPIEIEKNEVFTKLRSLFFCLVLCKTITMCCHPILTNAVGKKWLDPKYD